MNDEETAFDIMKKFDKRYLTVYYFTNLHSKQIGQNSAQG